MTVAAMTWVFKQKIPPTPKMVLLTLADQADDETGRVCYGRTDLDHIAAKASVGKRSLYRYIGALVLNGYLVRESGAEKGAPNQYWLCLEREPASEKWKWVEAEDAPDEEDSDEDVPADEGPDIDGEGENLAPPESAEKHSGGGDNSDRGGVTCLAHKESLEDQSTKASAKFTETKSGFSKKAQDLDRDKLAKEREAAKPARYFVIEGTRAYEAWAAEMRRRTGLRSWNLTIWASFEGRQRCGWYFPSLFPPANKPTAPPELSDEDARALSGM